MRIRKGGWRGRLKKDRRRGRTLSRINVVEDLVCGERIYRAYKVFPQIFLYFKYKCIGLTSVPVVTIMIVLTGRSHSLSRRGGGACQVFWIVRRAVFRRVVPERQSQGEPPGGCSAARVLTILAPVSVLVLEVPRPGAEGGSVFLPTTSTSCRTNTRWTIYHHCWTSLKTNQLIQLRCL